VAAMMAKGEIPAGSIPLELAVPGAAFVREARKRGISVTERIRITQAAEEKQAQVV